MRSRSSWLRLLEDAHEDFRRGDFPLRAYSEFMPAPWVGVKPYDRPGCSTATRPTCAGERFTVSEYEEAQEFGPGLEKIAHQILAELVRLGQGQSCQLSRTLLEDNPAWPPDLARAAGRLDWPTVLFLPLALSRTQDDKGHVRWTLFGGSHHGPARAFWRSFGDAEQGRFLALLAWAQGRPRPSLAADPLEAGIGILPADGPDTAAGGWPHSEAEALPAFARGLLVGETAPPLRPLRTIVSFRPFGFLPSWVREAHLAGEVAILPSPASLIFFEHRAYRGLSAQLRLATQVPLLHLFPRSETSYGIRVPQSGWLDDEAEAPRDDLQHRVARGVIRTHRFQRIDRHANALEAQAYVDKVSQALFSIDPDALGLYGKPMARNAQIWSEIYEAILDGPQAGRAALADAAAQVERGGRFGYRFVYPAMRVGARSLFWHRPLIARGGAGPGIELYRPPEGPLLGHLSAETLNPDADASRPELEVGLELLTRPEHVAAAGLFEHQRGHAWHTTADNVRKLLEWRELLGEPVPRSLAERLVHLPRETTLDAWLSELPAQASNPEHAAGLAQRLRDGIAEPEPAPEPAPDSHTFEHSRQRAFEERLWRLIASLAEGEFRHKDNADQILTNGGRNGGTHQAELRPGPARPVADSAERDLDRLAEHLKALYRERIEQSGMQGRAEVLELPFRWETDFDFAWSKSWGDNQTGRLHERNLIVVIPGRDRGEAVIMGDHYDTAYMEDVYDKSRGGDLLRAAAAGADDNHSATAALLLAAEVLLELSRQGRLARDVWLVHLTGEEFPADCLGARALGQRLVEGRLKARDGDREVDLSATRVVGAFILDMVAHNHDHDPDVFQIAPGEGAQAARLAVLAHRSNERWNRLVPMWNRDPERRGRGRGRRVASGAELPVLAEHLVLAGEVRPEWDPRSALYNTDAQIFSDLGIPVVLFMENYDISRQGYHDSHDTMKNIDLDYGAALIAIAIETVAEAAGASRTDGR